MSMMTLISETVSQKETDTKVAVENSNVQDLPQSCGCIYRIGPTSRFPITICNWHKGKIT